MTNALAVNGSFSPPRPIRTSVYAPRDWPQVAPVWTELERSSPYSSFYLSTDWTTTWLQIFGEILRPQILVFEAENTAVGVCLLVTAIERRGPFRVKRIYLNTDGGDVADRTLMEFNGVLCREGWEDKVAEALGAHLRALDWDEFAIAGISPGPMLTSLQSRSFPELHAEISLRPSFYVDLDRLRQSNIEYEKSLSPNTREQLRRSLRLYAESGELRIEVAPDLAIAEKFFAEMCSMHQSTWMERGETGAFTPGRRLEFHRALIQRAFPAGCIQMVRVSAGGEAIGNLYNFVRNGKVYFFQSGFHYKQDNRLKPGLVTHALAIRYCLQAGFRDYDFLAGNAQYKRSLAKDCRQLAWVIFSRRRVKLVIIDKLRAVKHRLMKAVQEYRK